MATQTESQSNSAVSPIPMQPPIPTNNTNNNTNTNINTNNPSTPLPNPTIPPSNPNNNQTIQITQPNTTETPIQPKNPTPIQSEIPQSKPLETMSATMSMPPPQSTIINQQLIQQTESHPNDKDSRRLKRNNRNIQTPSHKLLTLHHKLYSDMNENDIRKYLTDCPSELLIDCLIDQSVSNIQMFNDFDNYALIDPTKIRIFIRGLNYDTTKETLAKAFQRFGTVVDSTVIYDKTNNRSKGYGFITFSTSVEAAAACRHGQLEVDSRRTQISLATPLRNKSYGTSGDRDNRRDSDRDHRRYNRNNRSRSRSRSRDRDRDNRRHNKRNRNDNRNRNNNNNRFNRDRRNNNRHNNRNQNQNNQNKYGQITMNNRTSTNTTPGYVQHTQHTQHQQHSAQPPHPHHAVSAVAQMTNPYGAFNYGYDATAYAAYGNPATYNVAGVNTNTNVTSAVTQPQYNANLYAQQYGNYNPYFAGK